MISFTSNSCKSHLYIELISYDPKLPTNSRGANMAPLWISCISLFSKYPFWKGGCKLRMLVVIVVVVLMVLLMVMMLMMMMLIVMLLHGDVGQVVWGGADRVLTRERERGQWIWKWIRCIISKHVFLLANFKNCETFNFTRIIFCENVAKIGKNLLILRRVCCQNVSAKCGKIIMICIQVEDWIMSGKKKWERGEQ